MAFVNPVTGQPLPPNAIQRVLFVGPKVLVYQIPPLTSSKGYRAAGWTDDPQRHIFTARLRILETSLDEDEDEAGAGKQSVKIDVLLEDPASGQLFAAAPYTDAAVVEPALDSARFFAVRVQDGQGRRAVLGIGFEERPDAFDFGVALQEARKAAGLAASAQEQQQEQERQRQQQQQHKKQQQQQQRDYSLKDGETITVNLGASKFGRRSATGAAAASTDSPSTGLSSFSLPPPPSAASSSSSSSSSSLSSSSSAFSLPPPPPPARRAANANNRRSIGDAGALGLDARPVPTAKSAVELGFDDGQFGEFA